MPSPLLHTKGRYWTAEDGFRFCEKIARDHYENFPVASLFVPKELRRYVWAIYAFARTADDFADEPGYTLAERMDNLTRWEQYLLDCYNGNPTHRIFAALAETVERFQIPIELFQDLLAAFRSDVTVRRYETFDDVLAYCRKSANPIGRLILILFNYRAEAPTSYSDNICTALQLTNFWQDVSSDRKNNRIYIPLEDLEEFGCTEESVLQSAPGEQFGNLMAFEVQRTVDLFVAGRPLLSLVDKKLAFELKITWNGGMRILKKIHELGYNVLQHRPRLLWTDKLGLLFRSFFL
jgi:squalene synthase HpnC